MVLPDQPLRLTPEAARALLRILLKAHARLAQEESQMTGHATSTMPAPEKGRTR